MRKRHAVILVAIAVLAAAPVFAAGFSFSEQSAKASAEGGAWVARADDAAANWYNPAALVHNPGMEVQFGTNWLDIGSNTSFTPAGGGAEIDAVSNSAFPSTFYFAQKINDRVAWGIGLNNPFGLTTEWNDVPLTLSSKRAELATFLLNPNIAFGLNKYFSVAVGADYLAAQVTDFSRDTAVSFDGGETFIPTTANLTGEGTAIGYNVALQFKMKVFAFGAQYRSVLNPVIRGNLKFSGAPGNFLNSPASATLNLPAETMLGAAYTGKRFDVELGAYYTEWNVFKSLDIQTNNPATSATLTENWTGVWSYRLGVAVRVDKEMHHEIRLGGVWDDSPIPVNYLRPSIPDSDRTGYSLGYGWQGKHFGVDVYGMQLDFKDVTANGSPADGVINGTYKTSILLVGGSFKYRF